MTDSTEDLLKEIRKLAKTTKKLQTNYKTLSNSVKELNKKLKNLQKTVQSNQESIENHTANQETDKIEDQILPIDSQKGEHSEIMHEQFIPALNTILFELKQTEKKEYVDIKTVKDSFFEKYSIRSEPDFEQWLMEAYWSGEIELISGLNSRGYSVKDMYDNVYHHIKF